MKRGQQQQHDEVDRQIDPVRWPEQRDHVLVVPSHQRNGGSHCEDPPGVREGATGKLYLAYLRDPDGNKICALHRLPKA